MDTLQFIGGDFEVDPCRPTLPCELRRANSGGRDSGLLGVRPVVPFMSFEDPNRLAYQYLLVAGQGAKTTTLVLGGHPSSHSRRLRVVLDCSGARRVRGPTRRIESG